MKREDRFNRADRIIRQMVRRFQPGLAAEAESVGWVLHDEPFEGVDPDTLGYYPSMEEGRVSEQPGPVFLFIGPIVRYCRWQGSRFDNEVRLTYLHEFGHHLGWDEVDLENRGLD